MSYLLTGEENLEFLNDGVGFNYNYEFNHIHTHDYYEFVYFEKELLHIHNGKKYVTPPHSVIIIKPTDSHALKGISENNNFSPTHLNLKISVNALKTILETIDAGLFDLIEKHPPFSPIVLAHYKFISKSIYELLTKPQKPKSAIIKKLILRIIEAFEDEIYYSAHKTEQKTPEFIYKLLFSLSSPDNFTKSLTDICKDYNYSYAQLSRIFKKNYNQNLQEFFIEQKLQYAKNLLTNTDYTILSIALEAGYTLSHFDHVFSATYKMSPAEYRKKYAKTIIK